jgi:hypothetical protein
VWDVEVDNHNIVEASIVCSSETSFHGTWWVNAVVGVLRKQMPAGMFGIHKVEICNVVDNAVGFSGTLVEHWLPASMEDGYVERLAM